MNRDILRHSAFMSLLAVSILAPSSVRAGDWPQFRQNNHHTGFAPGEGALTIPAARGRTYLGGTLGTFALLAEDINDDGQVEVATVVGGKVIVKDTQDRVLWDTPNIRAAEIMGRYDFDGDNSSELLVLGLDGLTILRGRDGKVLWHKTGFQTSNNNTNTLNTRVVDFDNDGRPDIVTKAWWWSDGLVHGYAFASGFNSSSPDANQVWSHDIYDYDGGYYPAVGDVNLDGVPDVVSSNFTDFEIFNGRTGAPEKVYHTDHIIYYGRTQIVNIDDDPQAEVVHYTESSVSAIEVFDVINNPTAPTVQITFPSSNRLFSPTNAVGDLDHDGVFELVINRWDGTDWHGLIYQYREKEGDRAHATLTPVVDLVDQVISGLVDVDADGVPEILTRATLPGQQNSDAFTTLRVYGYQDGAASRRWEYPRAAWQSVGERGAASLNIAGTSGAVAAQDVDGDGRPELYVTVDEDGDLLADQLLLIDGEGDAAHVSAHYAMSKGDRVSVVWTGNGLTSSGSPPSVGDILVMDTDGVLWGLDAHLQVSARIRVGGYYSRFAQVVDLDGDGVNELLTSNGSNVLKALDPLELDQSGLPDPVRWTYEGAAGQYALSADLDHDGHVEQVVRNSLSATRPLLQVLNEDGVVLNSLELASAPTNLILGDFVGNSDVDVFGVRYASDATFHLFVIDGSTWKVAWEVVAPNPTIGVDEQTLTVADLDGDTFNDIAFGQSRYLCFASGKDGSSLGCSDQSLYGGGLLTGQLDSDVQDDLIVVTSTSIRKLDAKFKTDWTYTGAAGMAAWASGSVYRDVAMADADGDGLMEVYAASVDTLYRVNPDGTTGWYAPLYLGAVGTGGTSARLGSVAVGDLDGDTHLEVLVNSSDGYLYCLDADTGHLEWAFNFFYGVGDPVLGDVDGDGLLDVSVPVADGYLYLLTQSSLPAPSQVRDVAVGADGKLIDPSTDVDQTEVTDRLGAAWNPVEGAAGYMYAVLSDNGTYVVDWTDAGNVTQVVITDSRLLYGHLYHVLVQAYKADRSGSPWVQSNGVEIIDQTPPTVSDVRANPNPFEPLVTGTQLEAQLQDLTGLVSFTAQVLDGQTVLYATTQGAASTSMTAVVPWDGRYNGQRVADGTYRVVFSTTDYGGHVTSAEGSVVVAEVVEPTPTATPEPTPTATPVPSPSPTPGGDDDATSTPGPTSTPGGDDDSSPVVTPTPGGDDDSSPVVTPTPGGDDDSSPVVTPTPGGDDDSTGTDGGDDDSTGGGGDTGTGCDCATLPGSSMSGDSQHTLGMSAGFVGLAVLWIGRRRKASGRGDG